MWFGWMRNLILPNFKKVSQSEFVRKSYDRFSKAEYDSESKSGEVKTCCLSQQRLIQWMEMLKQSITMNLGLAKR
jgi:hypothetical protein